MPLISLIIKQNIISKYLNQCFSSLSKWYKVIYNFSPSCLLYCQVRTIYTRIYITFCVTVCLGPQYMLGMTTLFHDNKNTNT